MRHHKWEDLFAYRVVSPPEPALTTPWNLVKLGRKLLVHISISIRDIHHNSSSYVSVTNVNSLVCYRDYIWSSNDVVHVVYIVWIVPTVDCCISATAVRLSIIDLKVVLLDHEVAVDIPNEHEWD